jgi:hypothetical protein
MQAKKAPELPTADADAFREILDRRVIERARLDQ